MTIEEAIRMLDDYKDFLVAKSAELVEKFAEMGQGIAEVRFHAAEYDGTNDVQVSKIGEGNFQSILAVGTTPLFIEFGTGVRYPDDHPAAAENGMIRGSYGWGLGKDPGGWYYIGSEGTNGERMKSGWVHTYGNPANAPMYRTVEQLKEAFRNSKGWLKEFFKYG